MESWKNMFTCRGWGWCRSLRFPSWSVPQCRGGWFPLGSSRRNMRNAHLCLSQSFSLSLTFLQSQRSLTGTGLIPRQFGSNSYSICNFKKWRPIWSAFCFSLLQRLVWLLWKYISVDAHYRHKTFHSSYHTHQWQTNRDSVPLFLT